MPWVRIRCLASRQNKGDSRLLHRGNLSGPLQAWLYRLGPPFDPALPSRCTTDVSHSFTCQFLPTPRFRCAVGTHNHHGQDPMRITRCVIVLWRQMLAFRCQQRHLCHPCSILATASILLHMFTLRRNSELLHCSRRQNRNRDLLTFLGSKARLIFSRCGWASANPGLLFCHSHACWKNQIGIQKEFK
jgi:hypothetical protein